MTIVKEMTENRRIFWNVVATYGRSLFVLVVGIFTARWVLNALGEVDYGLMGVVGGLSAFIAFINSELAFANSRFYAVSVGAVRTAVDKKQALEECRRWFNTALTIHAVLPIVLIVIGYPIGVWVIEHYLTIPADRVYACIWVFRFTCLSCLVGMLNVPFSAMYGAKQYIAELTIYSFVTTTLKVVIVYYMITHPGDWLAKYAFWTCMMSVVPAIIIGIRACCVFPECRIVRGYMWDVARLKQVASFAGWHTLGATCVLLRIQGVAILVNKAFGPAVNAAMTIGNNVNANATTLGGALRGAFSPAIMNACGARDHDRMMKLAFGSCKFGTMLNFLFMIPLIAELDNILQLWLKTPPTYTGILCLSALLQEIVDGLARGHCAVIDGSGRIAEYHKNMTVISILTLPAAILVVWCGGGVWGLALLLVLVRTSIVLRRVYYSRLFGGVPIMPWIRTVVLPLVVVFFAGISVGVVLRVLMDASIWRVMVTTVFVELVILPLAWIFVFDTEERRFVLEKLKELRLKCLHR